MLSKEEDIVPLTPEHDYDFHDEAASASPEISCSGKVQWQGIWNLAGLPALQFRALLDYEQITFNTSFFRDDNHEKPLSVYSYDHAYILTIVEEVVPCLNSSPMRCGHPMLPVQV